MLLDIYDLIKQTKAQLTLERTLASTDLVGTTRGVGPFASDIANCKYEIINHRKGEAVKCEFINNATLSKSSV